MKRLVVLALFLGATETAVAQQRKEQFYLPGAFNWSFLHNYPAAARLFNAFDYGHAVLYERLLTRPGAPAAELEEEEFGFVTRDLLRRPPKFSIAEEAVMPKYAALVWRAVQMFDWAHVLHRQIYDIYSDERIASGAKAALVERVIDYYLSNHGLAFTTAPKSMALMDDAYYSKAFRRGYPKFNGLIWSYHWLQVGLYEPLIGGETAAVRAEGVAETGRRFQAMVDSGLTRFPEEMPMTSAVAPRFSARHPRAAVIFDNLHMMHDIISDILSSDRVSREGKQRAIEEALAEFRDGSRQTMSMEEWREMAAMMGGVERMGGVAWRPPMP